MPLYALNIHLPISQFIFSLKFNNKRLKNVWINYSDIANGGVIDYKTTEKTS